MLIEIKGPFLGKSSTCEPILRSLPQWFGLEEANLQYLQDIEVMATFLAITDGETIGFLTLKHHNQYSEEILIMGVKPSIQRNGTGKALVSAAENYLAQRGVEYLHVKTLSDKHPDLNYAGTRDFYLAMGFRSLVKLDNLWNIENPALIMIKYLQK
jgi:GNAT superfamily N-acetyltransferase